MATMEITTRIGCSVACSFCPQSKLAKAYVEARDNRPIVMSVDVFETCIDKLPKVVNIDFAGMAEPWLNPDCTKMLLRAHSLGHTVGVYTTLKGMTVEDVDAIEHVPFRVFEVHLPSLAGSEQIKVGEPYLGVLGRLRKSRIPARFHFFEDEVDTSIVQLLPKEPNHRKKHTRAGNVKIAGKPMPTRNRNQGVLACRRKLDYNILLPNGDVALCCMDYGLEHVLGNLVESDYDALFESDAFKRVERGQRDES